MKRAVLGLAVAFVTIFVAVPVQADVNDFVISDFNIGYRLSRDGEKRSRLTTTETITAVFPNYDQNHGIERAIPQSYDGHSTDLHIKSVTKANGTAWNYSTYESNDNLVLRIGDADRYVHGTQTYVIEYTQRDVTRFFSDTKSDEFYWDTNGTEWKVPIQKLDITLAVDPALSAQLTGEKACYQGGAGSSDRCNLTQTENDIVTSAADLSAGENVTIAVGFKQGTFNVYQASLWEKIWMALVVLFWAITVIGVGIIIWLCVKWSSWSKRKKEVGTIVPEYLPPPDTSLTTAASFIAPKGSVFTAQLLDFAVRHYIKIYQTSEKSLFRPAEYDLEIIKDISTLKKEEQEILSDIFGSTSVGQRLALSTLKNNTAVYLKMSDNPNKLNGLTRGDYGLQARNESQKAWFNKAAWVLFAAAIVLLSPALLVAAGVAAVCAYTLWPFTDKGLKLHRYLEGLKMYVGVAETERLKMLQSPEGAAKVSGTDPNNPAQLVKLYERVLPYAVLFGQEKEWTKRIGDIYESSHTQPSWYAGSHGAFNAAAFSSAMSGFSSTASYSSASSSSSGGSSGGGSSGGGGGGGGGGGW